MATFSEGDRVRVIQAMNPSPPQAWLGRVGEITMDPIPSAEIVEGRRPTPLPTQYLVLFDGDLREQICQETWLEPE